MTKFKTERSGRERGTNPTDNIELHNLFLCGFWRLCIDFFVVSVGPLVKTVLLSIRFIHILL